MKVTHSSVERNLVFTALDRVGERGTVQKHMLF